MSNKFKLYQTFHKKIASAIFNDDKQIKALIDNALEKELNKSWAITRPFKRLYLKATRNDDNLIKGLKNLAPAYINYAKDYASDYLANNLSNEISNMPWEQKLELFRHAMSSPFSESSAKYLNDLGINYFKQNQNKLKEDLLNRLKPSINGYKLSMKDLYERLNAGDFNNKEVANKFLNALDKPDYNREANPLYKYLIKGKVRGTLDELDKNIGESFKLPKTASIKRALSNYISGGGSDNAEAFEDSGVAANRYAFSASSPEANRWAFRGGVSAGLLGNGQHVNYSTNDDDFANSPIAPLSANDIFNINNSDTYTYSPDQNMLMHLDDDNRDRYGFLSRAQLNAFRHGYNPNEVKNPADHNAQAANAWVDSTYEQNKRRMQNKNNTNTFSSNKTYFGKTNDNKTNDNKPNTTTTNSVANNNQQ